jgi:hypothetical protein
MKGANVELIPSERAVLRQVLDLFLEASLRTHRFSALSSRWPSAHYQAYRQGFDGLVRKGLIAKTEDEQSFSITNAALKALA